MSTPTMNAKLNLLDEMAQVLAAPQTKRVSSRTMPSVRPAVRVRKTRHQRTTLVVQTPTLWRATLNETRDTLAERFLTWSLFVAAGAGLAWLGFTMLQFFFAWSQLVTWVRAAMI